MRLRAQNQRAPGMGPLTGLGTTGSDIPQVRLMAAIGSLAAGPLFVVPHPRRLGHELGGRRTGCHGCEDEKSEPSTLGSLPAGALTLTKQRRVK